MANIFTFIVCSDTGNEEKTREYYRQPPIFCFLVISLRYSAQRCKTPLVADNITKGCKREGNFR